MRIIIMLVLMSSCTTTQLTTAAIDAAMHRITPASDSVCIDESYDFFNFRKGIHVHCADDYSNHKDCNHAK